MTREIFVNLSVRDLQKSKDFFSALAFTFNPQLTDDKAACMIISDKAYVMLLTEPFLRGFTKLEPCDTSKATEAMFARSSERKAEVDQPARKRLDAGGRPAMD